MALRTLLVIGVIVLLLFLVPSAAGLAAQVPAI